MTEENKWFCPACNRFMDSTGEARSVNSGSILIPQLLRYYNFKGAVIKNNRVNCCSEPLKLPILAEEQVCLFKDNSGWLKCDDTSVNATSVSVLSNSSSYFFFYATT